ncbi:hypothetical protein [Rothia sp. 32237D007AR]
MTHNVSRRTLAKGAAWAAPAVVATTAIPAYAASPTACSTATIKAIDTAFAEFKQTYPCANYDMELNIYSMGDFNGFVAETYVNVKNNSACEAVFTATNPLVMKIELVDLNDTNCSSTGRSVTSTATSWGNVQDRGYNAATKTRTYIWTFVGVIPASGSGDNEADFRIGIGDGICGFGRITSKIVLTPLALVPPSPKLPDTVDLTNAACAEYYKSKLAVHESTTKAAYTFRGDLGNTNGSVPYTTETPVYVNTPVDSTVTGNFTGYAKTDYYRRTRDGIF